jgi:hypothetical protein
MVVVLHPCTLVWQNRIIGTHCWIAIALLDRHRIAGLPSLCWITIALLDRDCIAGSHR